MINHAARFYFTVALVGAIAAIAYYGVVSDRAGSMLFLSVFVGAYLSGLVVVGPWVTNRAPWFAPESAPEDIVVGPSVAPRPSSWPLGAAIALGVLGVGLSVGAPLMIIGLFLAAIAAGGWTGQAFREDRTFTATAGARIWDRVVGPLGVPLGALALIAFIVICISRVLLAVNEHLAVVVALVIAVIVLAAFTFLATRRSTGTIMAMLGGFAVIALAAAGIAGASAGERNFEPAAPPPVNLVSLTAKGTQFSKSQITVQAGQSITVSFHNEDDGTYHNVAVYTKSTPAQPLDAGAPLKGVANAKYQFNSLQAGTYTFRCDFHSNMVGTLVVQ